MADLTTIEIIHARLLARYGSAWRAKWAGVDVDVVQKDWMAELAYCRPHSIDYALENLPLDFPPTSGQFREICRRAPAAPPEANDQPRRLERPKPDLERLKSLFSRMGQIAAGRKPTRWIADLEEKLARGEPVSDYAQKCLKQARENLSHRPADLTITSEDSRRTDELKRQASARVEAYLREHPEMRP